MVKITIPVVVVLVDVCGIVKPNGGFVVAGVVVGCIDFVPCNGLPTLAANTKFVFVPVRPDFAAVLAGVVVAIVLACPPSCPAKLNPVVLCPRAKFCMGCMVACVVACVVAGAVAVVVPKEKPEAVVAAGAAKFA